MGFGRFLSTNVYWNLTWRLFGTQASLYFALNFFVVAATSVLFATIAATHYGRGAALVAGLAYFALPNVIEGFNWISNDQHLLAHFLCALFVLLYFDARRQDFRLVTVVVLEIVLVLALLGNQLSSALLVVPMVDLVLVDSSRRSRLRWVTFGITAVTVALFYLRTRGVNTGPYATDFTWHTMINAARDYFGGTLLFWTWLAASVAGFAVAARRRDALHATLWSLGVAFLVPFLFFPYQRYPVYVSLGLAFFFLALWLLVYQVLRDRAPKALPAAVLVIVLALGVWGVSRFSEVLSAPRGSAERDIVAQMADIVAREGPGVTNYCFTSTATIEFPPGPDARPIPKEWGSLDFGAAFTSLVDASKQYHPLAFAARCDRVVRFDGRSLQLEQP